MTLRARITGTGMYVPERVVTNKDLEALMDTSDEWIRQRSGIEERRWITEGQAIFNLSPAETIRFYRRDLQVVNQE